MKKLFLISAVVGIILSFSSCQKNYAEIYEGNYTLTVATKMTTEVPGLGTFTKDSTITTGMAIRMNGENGDVVVSGYYNTTGYADEEGLHLKASNISITENGIAKNIVISHSTIEEPRKNKLEWVGSMAGTTTNGNRNGNIAGSIQNTAKKNK